MNIFDMKIGARVALAFGVVLATIGLLVLAAQMGLARVAANSNAMETGVNLQSQVTEMHLLAKDNAIASMVILVSSSTDLQARLSKEVADRDVRILKKLEALEKALAANEKDAAIVAEVRKRHRLYVAGVQRIVGMIKDGKQAEAAFAADEEMIPMLAPFLVALEKLSASQLENVNATGAANTEQISATRVLTIVAGSIAAILAAAAGIWLVRSITAPLKFAVAVADAVSHGDLTYPIDVKGSDEISSLLKALREMQRSLLSLVTKVRLGSDAVASASAEIASGNMDLSNRTEAQAAILEETDASMSQLGDAVRHNADSARQANQLALQASSVAAKGGEVVGRVVATMKDINDSSRRIGDIISVIDGIAFQTNILALNAAVEAARAGEQGRGFAVVASEVRSLAGRSADAAKEIKSLINASVERVEQGSVLVNEAGTTMTEVVGSIRKVSDLVGEISSASDQQATSVVQIAEAVTQLDQATQQNAALVEQMAAAASNMNSQSGELVQTVSVFKLGAEENIVRTAVRSSGHMDMAKRGNELRTNFAVTARINPVPSKQAVTKAVRLPQPLPTSKATVAAGAADEWETF
ncbi:methyl-accepting chemotaxis protein [Rhodoferax lacus]|uniref:Methyl-accepting chemotaxis protein n=1 Tax=Rhodoferax lacus TaxID=2184758 RepID=A0A3E1R9K7_9BURK|nr:methyl-accepting chemotaxis protein [Rhodoferax lacus]RFO95712.1 methyl-accepting chemotaxis protein [Rhodoferax lacus]